LEKSKNNWRKVIIIIIIMTRKNLRIRLRNLWRKELREEEQEINRGGERTLGR
jgi:hypothetical protein